MLPYRGMLFYHVVALPIILRPGGCLFQFRMALTVFICPNYEQDWTKYLLVTLPDLNDFSPLKTFKERDSDQRCRLEAGMGQLMDRVPLRKTRGFGTQPTNLVEKTTKTMPGMLERRVRRSRLTSLLPHNRGDAIRDFCCCQVWSLEEMPASCISDHPVAVEGPIFPQLQPENTKYQKMQSKETHSVLLFCNSF